MDSVVDFEMDNKTPGKDITAEDLETKFPLAAKKHDNHKTVVKIDDIEIGGNELIIFAGPNTVENREMILETAEQVKKRGAHFLRAGAYKPLTFPNRSDSYFELREKSYELLISLIILLFDLTPYSSVFELFLSILSHFY